RRRDVVARAFEVEAEAEDLPDHLVDGLDLLEQVATAHPGSLRTSLVGESAKTVPADRIERVSWRLGGRLERPSGRGRGEESPPSGACRFATGGPPARDDVAFLQKRSGNAGSRLDAWGRKWVV